MRDLLRRPAAYAALSGVSLLAACPGPNGTTDGPPACTTPFIGDKSQPPQMTLVYSGADGTSQPVTDGGTVPMLLPLQGGRVIYVGARVTNIDPCNAQLTGSIRDLGNNQVRLDSRTVNLTRASDGWGETSAGDLSSFANIPACPNEWSSTSLFDATYQLEVQLKDQGGRTAKATADVKPSCGDTSADLQNECKCICKKGYTLGEVCQGGAGGGASASSSAAATSSTGTGS